jgi:hypothetical protein
VLEAREHREGKILWIYPIMEEVIQGIEENDAACIALGVDFVEEDDLFAFGKALKSNTARSPPEGEWVSRKESKSYVCTLVYV